MDDNDSTPLLSPPPPPPSRSRRRRSSLARLSRLVLARVSGAPLLALLMLPVLPPGRHNACFEVLPAYKSLSALLSSSSSLAHTRTLQQWLGYWTLYAAVRFLEATRFNVSTQEQRWAALGRALELLPRIIGQRLLSLFVSASKGKAPATRARHASAPREQTLAAQLAGSPARWVVLKCLLLFYAMDDELQGARWIIEKAVKPLFGFFTDLDNGEEAQEERQMDIGQQATRRTKRTHEIHPQHHNPLRLNLEDKASSTDQQQRQDEDEDEHKHTPELSLGESSGGSDDTAWQFEDEEPYPNTRATVGQAPTELKAHKWDLTDDKQGDRQITVSSRQSSTKVVILGQATTTWPSETIAVEGNYWIR